MLTGLLKLLAWLVGAVLLLVWAVDQANAQPSTYLPWQAGAAYRVTQGNNQGPSHNDRWNRYGWDFAMPNGTPVLASAPGRVTYAGWSNQGWGLTVVVCYGDGTCSRYAHLSAIAGGINPGRDIGQAQMLGRVGSTGRSSGPHLHYGLQSQSGNGLSSRFAEAGVPRRGDRPVSRNNPAPADPTPVFDDVRLYAGDPIQVTAGDAVQAVVTARYRGPFPIPCGQINLGLRGDGSARFGDWRNGFWPQSAWRSPNRVAAHGCNGNLDPGEYAEWRLPFRVPDTVPTGSYHIGYFTPVWDGVAWSGVVASVTLQVTGQYDAAFVGQSVTPLVEPGGQGTVSVALRNRGPATWSRDQVRLGTVGDRPFPFADSSWLNANRIPMREQTVAPGEVAHFEATFTVPADAGVTRVSQAFAPVVDGRQWFGEDIGINLRFFTGDADNLPYQAADYDARWLGQTYRDQPLGRDESAEVQVTYRNTGWAAWFPGGAHPVQYRGCRPGDRQSGFIDPAAPDAVGGNQGIRLPRRVDPGETVTLTLPLKVHPTVQPGTYREYFCLVAEGTSWFGPDDVWWSFTAN